MTELKSSPAQLRAVKKYYEKNKELKKAEMRAYYAQNAESLKAKRRNRYAAQKAARNPMPAPQVSV